jgi:type IV fimbrial biogenesis protein FimT
MLNARKGRPDSNGVSLIELMAIVAIVAILAILGLPAFTTWIQNTQIRTAAEGVLSGMQLARVEAVRRNRDVEFVLTSPSTKGGTGWVVRQLGEPPIQSRPDGEGSRNVTLTVDPAEATRLTFNSFGRISSSTSDGKAVLARVDVDSSGGHALRVTTAGGSPRMCDPVFDDDENANGDPRKC